MLFLNPKKMKKYFSTLNSTNYTSTIMPKRSFQLAHLTNYSEFYNKRFKISDNIMESDFPTQPYLSTNDNKETILDSRISFLENRISLLETKLDNNTNEILEMLRECLEQLKTINKFNGITTRDPCPSYIN
ncbi:hypothetical protein QJ857_gp0092 [Tupanvirus soda lake]|uniref:Uncharacterized protein n=2 Tax=Tupanvirus TaxID=2094720 RepID=A0A6N1P4N8_9VIRU|nr:hypothetical protein QJ857_gp0092 [Tupanvirus soda lake]QKU35931.1 hypothetical protein [Tupanvirus soda lake]